MISYKRREKKENTIVSIIGGADGPTAVFVAGKLNGNLTFILIVIGIVLLGVAVIAFCKRKH
ncbi:MAG: oxaloacetate decarboxylase [Faecalimonas umbilicata]|uniref:oxaloacetate decarboxylase n=1 Tax=Faecalimonas umbilicata TaxID=1912855 RepID=UPI001C1D1500|nr:oxaloacetate decarboxylase [Faecalimonas umbilicata]MDY5093313.1 oxaloacetate decarboxylase [Faecalimonas umbilicata]HBG0145896.1 oxaloacetate decarboxylase [Clostridioides difficile]HCQ5454329.1 oxaloacetate decarboxylase [Clostridioides difficile]